MTTEERVHAISEFANRLREEGRPFIDEIICKFDSQEKLKEEALHLLFSETFPVGSSKEATLIKVTCLNEYYSTRLNSNLPRSAASVAGGRRLTADILTMAEHVFNLESTRSLGNLIQDGNPEAVELIREIPEKDGIKFRDAYSFATKYCSWHNPEQYPIVDGYSKAMVYYLSRYLTDELANFEKIKQGDLLTYGAFCQLYLNLKEWINNTIAHESHDTYGTKDIDKVFWYYASVGASNANLYI